MDEERRDDGSDAKVSDVEGVETEGHGWVRRYLEPWDTKAPNELPKASDVEGHANLIGSVDPDEPGTEVEGHASRIRPSDESESEVEGHASRIRPSSPD